MRTLAACIGLIFLGGCAQNRVIEAAPEAAAPVVSPAAAPAPKPRVLGLALGGGAARGFAHVGVIQVLEEAGLRPAMVAGTSAGSLVAALYASGLTPGQLQSVAETMEEAMFTDWTLPFLNRGVLRGEALARFVSDKVAGRQIQELPMPLGIVATNLRTGQAVVFRRGDTATAVRASSAVPAVFLPVRIGESEYVDGGLVAPVPVRQVRDMGADVVLAVDISSPPDGNPTADTLQVLLQTFAVMGQSINVYALREADVVVRPALLGVRAVDFGGRRLAIAAGRQAALQALPALREALQRPAPAGPTGP